MIPFYFCAGQQSDPYERNMSPVSSVSINFYTSSGPYNLPRFITGVFFPSERNKYSTVSGFARKSCYQRVEFCTLIPGSLIPGFYSKQISTAGQHEKVN